MECVSLVAEGWAAHGVGHARTFRERWRGVKTHPNHRGLLMETRSVHGFGLRAPLLAVAITSTMQVSSVRLLRQGGVLFFPGARFVLELPVGADPPPVGSTVEIRGA